MALVECRECGKPVAGDAKTCPQCGVDAPNPEIFALLETASHFAVKPSDFDRYDAEAIRAKARGHLEQVGLEAMMAEKKKQDGERIKRFLFWGFIAVMLMSFAMGLFDAGQG